MGERRYDAFLCHSSQDDLAVSRLHRRLEAYRPPRGVRQGGLRVFHYVYDQALDAELRAALQRELDDSAHLLLVASPAAAASEHVAFEIEHFLTSRRDRVRVALIAGQPPDVYPETLRNSGLDPMYADLRGFTTYGRAAWVLWGRRRLDRALLPLIAGLLGVRQDELVRREAARRRVRTGMISGAILAVGIAAIFAFLRTPSEAWTATDADQLKHGVHNAALVEEHPTFVIAQSWWEQSSNDDDSPSNPTLRVMTLDRWGKKLNTAEWFVDAGGEGGIYRRSVDGPRARELNVTRWDPQKHFWSPIRKGGPCLRCDIRKSAVYCADWMVASYDDTEWMTRVAKGGTQAALAGAIPISVPVFFRLHDDALLAFTYFSGKGASGTLAALRHKGVESWTTSTNALSYESHSIKALAESAGGHRVLTLAVSEDEYGFGVSKNKLLRSSDDGMTWIEIPFETDSMRQLYSVATAWHDPNLIAVSTHDARPGEPANSEVFLSDDAGGNWRRLDTAAPKNGHIDLIGVSGAGDVVALVHPGKAFSGYAARLRSDDRSEWRLVVWRRLSFFERVSGERGLSY